ncbi:uncharacterized protein LOC134546356 isoform X2 [Bacillus rossius redtenbacheri]|uniref:uncharacterized protein LOC134546356 isoform X2 n=1 Tax=Bacillus rossius redtenbacheri TaxID=93214 RepID=UPI002FDEC9B6
MAQQTYNLRSRANSMCEECPTTHSSDSDTSTAMEDCSSPETRVMDVPTHSHTQHSDRLGRPVSPFPAGGVTQEHDKTTTAPGTSTLSPDMTLMLQQVLQQLTKQTEQSENRIMSQLAIQTEQSENRIMSRLSSQAEHTEQSDNRIMSQLSKQAEQMEAKLDITCSSVQSLEHSIEEKLVQQQREINQAVEKVTQTVERVWELETQLLAIRENVTLEQHGLREFCHRSQVCMRDELHGQTRRLEVRLDDIEVATSNLRDCLQNLTVSQSRTPDTTGGTQREVTEVPPTGTGKQLYTTPGCSYDTHPAESLPRQSVETRATVQPRATTTTERHLDPVALMHHPAKLWAEAMPTFAGRANESPMRFLRKFEEYVAMFNLTDGEILKCLNNALKGQAFYWWVLTSTNTHSFTQFRELFRLQFWNIRIQSNLRAQLHTEKYDPRKGTSLEAHLSTMYDKTRYLDLPMTNEFVAAMLTQLPLKYQKQLSGLHYRDVTEFRDRLLNYDKLEKLDRVAPRTEEADRAPPHQKQHQVNPYWQGREGKQKPERQAAVNYMSWQARGEAPRGNGGPYHNRYRGAPYNRKRTWWPSNKGYHSGEEGAERARKSARYEERRRSYSPEQLPPRESRNYSRRASSDDEREYHYNQHRRMKEKQYHDQCEDSRLPYYQSPKTTDSGGGKAHYSHPSEQPASPNRTFRQSQQPGTTNQHGARPCYLLENPVAAEFKSAVQEAAGTSTWYNNNRNVPDSQDARVSKGTLN